VLRRVKRLIRQGEDPEAIALVVRHEVNYRDLIERVSEEYGLEVSLPGSVALEATQLGSFLRALFRAVQQGLPYRATLRLLQSPLGPGLRLEGDRPQGEAWKAYAPELFWLREALLSEYRDRFTQLLKAYRIDEKLDHQLPRGSFARLLEALAQLKGARLSLGEFAARVEGLLGALSLPWNPRDGAVSLRTPLTMVGGKVRHLFLLGVAEGIMPARVREDPLLDEPTREALRRAGYPLEGIAERTLREQLFLLAVAQAGEQIYLSYPQLEGGRPRLPSFLFELTRPPQRDPLRLAASREEMLQATLIRQSEDSRPRRALAVEYGRLQGQASPYHGELPEDALKGRVYTLQELEAIQRCGFQWFAAYGLGLIDAERGRLPLYRKVLNRLITQSSERAELLANLPQVLEEIASELGWTQSSGWSVRRVSELAFLRRVLEHPSFLEPEAQVLKVDLPFEGNWPEMGIRVRGWIDRLDRTPRGLTFLVYGLGQPSWSLFLLRHIAVPQLLGEEAPVVYLNLGRAREEVRVPGSLDLLGLRAKLAGHLQPQPGSHCLTCPVQLVCRKGD
jgi:hypothetical protein